MGKYNKPTEHVVRQVRFLLLNKSLSYKDIERIIRYKTCWNTVRQIHLENKYPDVLGFEPPEDYETYYKSYCSE
jgi:hypothetical protein